MTINIGNLFDSSSFSQFMLRSLPANERPQLRNAFDAAALLAHACMLIVGFRLEGLGEDHRVEVKSEGTDVHSLPREWNATSSYNYSFRYAHNQSSLKYLIKISRLGGKVVVNGIGLGDDKVHTMDFPIKDFFLESTFPYTASPSRSQNENARAIQNLFISAGRITDLGSLLKIQIIQKLAPGLRKEGYEESTTEEHDSRRSSRDRETTPTPPDPLRDPRLPGRAPSRPLDYPPDYRPYPAGDFHPPGFDDEYEINRPWPTSTIGGGPERRPLNIGERDLYPPGLGPNDPFRPFAGGGFAPGAGGTGGGGMHPTFDDPLFAGGNRGGGPRGYDPRAPPGARYDPVGPGGEAPWGSERPPPGAPRGGFGGGGNPYPYRRGDYI